MTLKNLARGSTLQGVGLHRTVKCSNRGAGVSQQDWLVVGWSPHQLAQDQEGVVRYTAVNSGEMDSIGVMVSTQDYGGCVCSD